MPVAEFPGDRGWGYDGAYLWSAQSSYGGPEGLARLVDAAHATGLAVILDLVPNHVGASGAQALEAFGAYFTDRYGTFWGRAMNYDDALSDGTREWLVQAGEAWVTDLHLDGFRLDAIHAVFDSSARNVLAQFAARVHAARPGALVIAECGLNDPKVMRPESEGGFGHDAAWADDFHHALRTLADRRSRRLLRRVRGRRAAREGLPPPACPRRAVLHVPPPALRRARRRRPPARFVVFSANHDQIGNRAFGDRLPRELRPLAAMCTLLSPFIPLVFQGEEYGERAPFQFFTDHIDEDIAEATREGRRAEFASFASFVGRGHPGPAGDRDVPALEAHARRRSGDRRAVPRPAGAAPRAAGRRRRGDRPRRRGPAGCVCAAATGRSSELRRACRRAAEAPARGPASAPRRPRPPSRRVACGCPPCPGRWSGEP